jgi:hypothetical protein
VIRERWSTKCVSWFCKWRSSEFYQIGEQMSIRWLFDLLGLKQMHLKLWNDGCLKYFAHWCLKWKNTHAAMADVSCSSGVVRLYSSEMVIEIGSKWWIDIVSSKARLSSLEVFGLLLKNGQNEAFEKWENNGFLLLDGGSYWFFLWQKKNGEEVLLSSKARLLSFEVLDRFCKNVKSAVF